MKVTLFTWDLREGPFALGCGAYAKGLQHWGVDEIHVLHLNRHTEREILPVFPPGVKFVCLPARHSREAPLAVAKYLRQHQPDLFYSMPLHVNLAAVMGRLLARTKKTKLLVGERAMTSTTRFIGSFDKLSRRMVPSFKRFFYPRASGVVCNSQAVVDDLIENIRVPMPRERLIVIPPAIDVECVTQWKEETIHHPWLDEKKYPVIITVARLSSEKNLPLLIEAFARVRRQIDCRLLILGEGPERRTLEAMVRQNGLTSCVDLMGQVLNPWAYMARSDLFVLTSTEESFGRVLVEAMACGLPTIATDAIGGGPRMILEDSRYGKLVPNGDLEALVGAMLAVLEDIEVAQELREQGALRVSIAEPVYVAKTLLDFAASLEC